MEYWCWLEILLCKILAHGEVSCGLIQMRRTPYIKEEPPPCSTNNSIPLLSSSKHTHRVLVMSVNHHHTQTSQTQQWPHENTSGFYIWVSSFLLRQNVCDLRPGRQEICMPFMYKHPLIFWLLLMVLSMLLYGY